MVRDSPRSIFLAALERSMDIRHKDDLGTQFRRRNGNARRGLACCGITTVAPNTHQPRRVRHRDGVITTLTATTP